ncbi:hypothetical protein IH601_12460 [Candidatus Bipolaricaulota bacterium]|nr:hypothetical protein [Candidatus Bipolaricaulota bacterium]TFH09885.1 MAG: hypothetical protein E4H08_04805 [Candidatus Atribacteria bacterium]
MTRRRPRNSLLVPLVLVFVGIMFLLTNLGIVDRSIWSDIIRYWPVLLILMGVDALLRRSSMGAALGTLVSAAALIAVGMVLLHMFAPEAWTTREQAFSYPLTNATTAQIDLSCQDCTMHIRRQPSLSQPDTLINGSLHLRRDEKLTETVRRDGSQTYFALESHYLLPSLVWAKQDAKAWIVALNETVPVTLTMSTENAVHVDFTGIALQSADISAGSQTSTIFLPDTANAALYLSGSHIEVLVPEGIGVRVTGLTASNLSVPPTYVQTGSSIASPNYEQATYRTDIILRPGSEWIEIGPGIHPASP